ncbi:twin-arginine translocation signal domain-containing protein [Natrinema amylolyticum]|uniref:twin-arginine translocation signal domain-containing protein n=1 Tax=Natrinema amylolyticum TaxID=2878679 RepID=UPI001CFA0E5B|nr:twin-arginine translocation signal domain-containing protein [Natrinema amylolyticum]
MPEKQRDLVLSNSDDSRRSFMKKGALATGALALGASGTATAQEDDGVFGDLDDAWKALIQVDNFHPNARFTFVSGVIEWSPNYGDVQDSWFSDYNTYQIRWLNTDEVVPLYVAHDANIGEYDEELGFIPDADDDQNQPQLFEMNQEWTPFSDNNRLITVNASPVGEDEEDNILDTEDWWQNTE